MRITYFILLIILLPFLGFGQESGTMPATQTDKQSKVVKLPKWAEAQNYDASAHVYFPDYYTFYDPSRGGYLYWDNNNFSFSPTVPSFLEKVDLSKSRIQILKGLGLELHPEQNYPYYMNLYPANSAGNTKVPVPIPGNPAH